MTNAVQTPVSPELERAQKEDIRARLWFEQQPTVEDFNYVMHADMPVPRNDPAGSEVRERMLAAQEEADTKYGIDFTTPDVARESNKPIYVMVGPINLNDEMSVKSLSSTLGLIHGGTSRASRADTRINVANYFLSDKPPERAEIEEFDDENGCNTIYADDEIEFGQFKAVTAEDLLDNIVCETIRTKYRAIRDTSREAAYLLGEGKRATEDTITKLRAVFTEHRLWHRDTTDGAILIKNGGSVLISQTQSSKAMIVPKRFSVITDNNPKMNEISFAGERLPSSDSPGLIRLMENIELDEDIATPNLVVHFHHPTLTRDGKFPDNVTNEEIEYGQFESGDKIYQELKSKDTNWLILKNHGFIWLGNTAEEFEKFIEEISS